MNELRSTARRSGMDRRGTQRRVGEQILAFAEGAHASERRLKYRRSLLDRRQA
jgi:hypothetical protein